MLLLQLQLISLAFVFVFVLVVGLVLTVNLRVRLKETQALLERVVLHNTRRHSEGFARIGATWTQAGVAMGRFSLQRANAAVSRQGPPHTPRTTSLSSTSFPIGVPMTAAVVPPSPPHSLSTTPPHHTPPTHVRKAKPVLAYLCARNKNMRTSPLVLPPALHR